VSVADCRRSTGGRSATREQAPTTYEPLGSGICHYIVDHRTDDLLAVVGVCRPGNGRSFVGAASARPGWEPRHHQPIEGAHKTEQDGQRGAAEENTGVPETPEEHNEPASPSSTPGGEDSRADGAAEENTNVAE
jgi:hypothetical protein